MYEFIERFRKIHPAIRYLVVALVVALVLLVINLLLPPVRMGGI